MNTPASCRSSANSSRIPPRRVRHGSSSLFGQADRDDSKRKKTCLGGKKNNSASSTQRRNGRKAEKLALLDCTCRPEFSSLGATHLPEFPLNPDDVQVLYSPTEFHEELLRSYRAATRRVVLAALYVGTGEPEAQVVDAIVEAYKTSKQTVASGASNRLLEIDVLIDAIRGTRKEAKTPIADSQSVALCSLDMLRPLLELTQEPPFPSLSNIASHHPVSLYLFHSPLLSGLLHRILPARINEIMGVFHTKVFIADDSVILTGANLSESYLKDRQDRYVVIRHVPQLATFLHQFIRCLQRYSYCAKLQRSTDSKFSQASSEIQCHPYQDSATAFRPTARSRNVVFTETPSCRGWDITLAATSSSKAPVVELRLANSSTPCPVNESQAFRASLGKSLYRFLHTQCTSLKHMSLPSHSSRTQAVQQPVAVDKAAAASTTFLRVALQVAFTYPPIPNEEFLFQHLLGPVPAPQHGFFHFGGVKQVVCHAVGRFLDAVKSVVQLAVSCVSYLPWASKTRNAAARAVTTSLSRSVEHIPFCTRNKPCMASFTAHLDEDQTTTSSNCSARSSSTSRMSSLGFQTESNDTEDYSQQRGDSTLSSVVFPAQEPTHRVRDSVARRHAPRSIHSFPIATSSRSPSKQLPFSCLMEHPPITIHKLVVASGYLNMPDKLLQLLSYAITQREKTHFPARLAHSNWHNACPPSLDIFMAAPDANSFHRSKGLSRFIPMAYSYVGSKQLSRLRQLWAKFNATNLDGTLTCTSDECAAPLCLHEYSRRGWTFHSKGLWLYSSVAESLTSPTNSIVATGDFSKLSSDNAPPLAQDTHSEFNQRSLILEEQDSMPPSYELPCATIIGSSNFGLRSSCRDLDMSFLIQTQDTRLQAAFHKEVTLLQKHSTKVKHRSCLASRCPIWLQFLLRWTNLKTLL